MPEPEAVVVHASSGCEVLQAQLGGWTTRLRTATKEAVVVDPFDAAFWFDVAASQIPLVGCVADPQPLGPYKGRGGGH